MANQPIAISYMFNILPFTAIYGFINDYKEVIFKHQSYVYEINQFLLGYSPTEWQEDWK